MSDAMLAYQLRGDSAGAERAGAMAVAHLEQAIPHRGRNNSDTASLGWVYFRMGSVAARDKHSHAQATGWFDRAVPLVEDSLPTSTPSEVGRQGEALVSMAVSYWELGRHDRALELTQRGADCIQKAVDAGALDKQALSVPYANLAAIHKHQGNKDRAQEYTAQADKLRGTTLK